MQNNTNKSVRNKKGAAKRLAAVLVREFWGLTKLNLYFVIYSLPLFTLGASVAAMHRVTIDMVNDIPTDPIYDFRRYFRAAFPRTLVLLILTVASVGASAFASVVYFFIASEKTSPIIYFPAAISVVCFVFSLCVVPYMFRIPELTAEKADVKKENIKIKKLVYRAFELSAMNIGRTLESAFVLFLALYLAVGFFPYSAPLFIFYGNAFFSVSISYIQRNLEFDSDSQNRGEKNEK